MLASTGWKGEREGAYGERNREGGKSRDISAAFRRRQRAPAESSPRRRSAPRGGEPRRQAHRRPSSKRGGVVVTWNRRGKGVCVEGGREGRGSGAAGAVTPWFRGFALWNEKKKLQASVDPFFLFSCFFFTTSRRRVAPVSASLRFFIFKDRLLRKSQLEDNCVVSFFVFFGSV